MGLLAFSLIACNQILENEKGVLDREASTTGTASTDPPATTDDETATGSDRRGESAPDAPRNDASPAQPSGDENAAVDCAASSNGATRACGAACVSVDDPLFGCGATDCTPCSVLGATPACVNGACSIAVCSAGLADCNANASDGCETDLSSPSSCGACGVLCPLAPHALPACTSLACSLACDIGWADCNANPLDGCETDLALDIANCGQCGKRCVIGRCAAGNCTIF